MYIMMPKNTVFVGHSVRNWLLRASERVMRDDFDYTGKSRRKLRDNVVQSLKNKREAEIIPLRVSAWPCDREGALLILRAYEPVFFFVPLSL